MTITIEDPLEQGTRNLLVNCAGCEPGQTVLVVYETEHDGYYDLTLLDELTKTADKLGLCLERHGVPLARKVIDPDADLSAKMAAADCTVFMARLGDQIRFRKQGASQNQIVSYALDREMLASPFGTVTYTAFAQLSTLIDTAIQHAKEVHITCPAGTDVTGVVGTPFPNDVTRKRFPVSVFAPVPALGFSGCVAQRGFLTGTGSNYYSPWSCEIEQTLFVHFEETQITKFEGSPQDVAAAEAHYERVGIQCLIDTYHMHSWHAGIHPGCAYAQTAGQHLERWSGSAFGNPRLLHFHTCGAYAPGEISLNVLDPTILLDGVAVWEDGCLFPERIQGGAALLQAYPDLRHAFENPSYHVGQSACGGLTYR